MEAYLSLSVPNTIWCAVVLFAASYIRGFSGFGFTAVLMTGLTLILPVTEIVPLSIALELAASLGQSFTIMRHVDWRKLTILLATGALCTPIGVYLLALLPDLALRNLVLIFIFGSSIYLIFSREHLRAFPLRAYALAGSAIGIVNGATALSGLVLALFFSFTDESPAKMRATMIAFLFLADFWAGGILLASGFYESVTIHRVLFSLPLLGLGVWLGSIHFASVGSDTFRAAILWLLLLLSVLGIVLVIAAQFA
jgi:hypothetical protein